ncbi:MAG: hypothetical protein MUF27_13790 [Acidobacteria bacterium]|jgi:multiple antibiotic resistance protein|nr:hypothetical protein [Acidobacteriota bacterium]
MVDLTHLPQLVVLFFVIFDPLASFAVFFALTEEMVPVQRRRAALLGLLVATVLSLLVLALGTALLALFDTTIDQFRVAGGIVLGLLGLRMSLGGALEPTAPAAERSAQAVAAVIATPLLTGPAAITAIIVSVQDYGRPVTGLAVAIVLAGTAVLFLAAPLVRRVVNRTLIQVLSTTLGLITLAWGVRYVTEGLAAILRATP